MRLFRPAVLGAVLLGFAIFSHGLQAQESRVREIVVQGNQRIEAETIRSYLSLAEGDAASEERIDKSLKSLFATGLFADVTIRQEGGALVVRVAENPIINRVAFEGNHKLKDEQLQSEVQLKARTVFTRTKVQSDVKRILDLYRRSGRFAATVEPKVIQLEQNRVDLAFEINEGPATYVSRINFVGNKQFSDSRLREVLQTKEERWYRFFSTEDTYDPDRLTYDRELLRRYYLKNGYADFRVISAVAELTPDRENFFITFTIEEGERYKVGSTDVVATLPELNVDELKPVVTSEPGDWYNADVVEESVQALTDLVGTKGYAFVDVKPRVDRKREQKIVDLLYEVNEGPRVFVERIDITGNVRTLDRVIRREMRLVEGDAFNTAKLRRSRQRIRDLNFFEKVEVETIPSDTTPDRTVIRVDVEEKSTGELSFGVGWSSAVGAMIEVGVRERNLLGKGQDLRSTAQLAQKRSEIDLSFTEPYFLDRRLAAGTDLFVLTRDLQDESAYDYDTKGGALRLGFNYNDPLRHDFKYTYKKTRIENVKSTASRYVQEQEGENTLSSVQHTLMFDKRDSRLEPTEGYYLRLNNEYAGLGGTQSFLRNNIGAAQYFSIAEQTVLSFSGSAGFMFGMGEEVSINERYYLGGDTLRGFADAGVSPRDRVTSDALGGLWQYAGSVQLDFPVGLPAEMGFTAKVFADVGAIGSTEDSVAAADVNQSSSLRASVGTGATWKSPMGPISLDLGFPVKKQRFDETEVFRINFGTRF